MEGSREGYQVTVGGTQTQFGQVVGEFKEDGCVRGDGRDPRRLRPRLRQGEETLAENVVRSGVAPYRAATESLGIRYEKAVNPLELTVVTGHAEKPLDFRTIERDVPCRTACPPRRRTFPSTSATSRSGRRDEAALINQEDNVLSGILGRICTRPCETRTAVTNGRASRGPVRICHLKSTAATDGKRKKTGPLPDYFERATGKKVAIVGGGPAGLAAAQPNFCRYGHAATIFEREAYLGGQIRIGIPEFRLPRAVIEETSPRFSRRASR